MSFLIRSFLTIAVCLTISVGAQLNAQSTATPAKTLSAQERLDACAKLYKGVKTYRDEGVLTEELTVQGRKIVSEKPFRTAFERGGRFHWQIRLSAVPGGTPDNLFTIWSANGESFDSKWTLNNKVTTDQPLDRPLASATGISSGAATAIIPLLNVSTKKSAWGLLSTDLVMPEDKGREDVDKVACTKIAGKAKFGDSKVTLWIDDAGLIRKIATETSIDPAKLPAGANPLGNLPAFTTYTTIAIQPVIDEAKIDDAMFKREEK